MGCTSSKVAPRPSAGSDGASAAALTPIWKPVLRENVPHQTQTALEPTIVPPVPHSSDRLAANVAAAGEFRGLCGRCGQAVLTSQHRERRVDTYFHTSTVDCRPVFPRVAGAHDDASSGREPKDRGKGGAGDWFETTCFSEQQPVPGPGSVPLVTFESRAEALAASPTAALPPPSTASASSTTPFLPPLHHYYRPAAAAAAAADSAVWNKVGGNGGDGGGGGGSQPQVPVLPESLVATANNGSSGGGVEGFGFSLAPRNSGDFAVVATITRRSDADVHNVHDSDELSVGDVIVTVNGIDTSTLTNATLRALVGNAQDVELEIATADQLAAATHSAQQQEPAATAAATDEAHEEMDAELNPDNIHRTCAVERGRGRGSNVGGTHALPAGNATGNRSPDGRQGAAVDSQPVEKEDDEVDKEGEVAAEDGDEEEEEAGAEEVAMLMQLQSLDIVDRLTATDPDDGSPLMIAAARRGWAAVVKQFVVHGGNPNVLDHVTGLTPLLAAARSGAANTVRALVKSGAALDVTHRENGATALVTASFHGHVKVVEILLGAGANPLLLTRATGASALFVAALCGWSRVVDLLCKHPNVEPSFRGHDSGATPAYAAAKNGHTAVLAVLTRYGADLTAGPQSPHVNMTPVFAACENGHANAVVYMMEHGVDVADLRGYGGMSPLHAAVWHGHVHVVRALYAKCGYSGAGGAADNGMYALHIAAEAGDSHLDLIGILVRRGTAIDLQTTVKGETALYLAARNGHQKVVAWLLEEGASPSIPTLAIPEMELSSVVPLHAAATNGHLDVLRMLANAGANLNVQAEPGGETACYTAAHDGRAKALALLADMGADFQLPARDGSTPIYIAAGRGKESCVRCLAALRADLSAKIEGIGVTPAFIAARFGHLTVLVILALQAADLQLRTEHGDACVQVARKYRHAQVVRFLSKLASLTGAARAAYIRKVERKARVNNECMQIAPPLSANADVRALPEHGLGQRKQHWTLEKRNNLSRVQKTAASNAGVLAAPVPRESSNVGYARDPPQPSIRRNSRYCQ